MEPLDYWRLCDALSVVQAALLIVGKDPSHLQDDVDRSVAKNRPSGYDAAKTALMNAIIGGRLPANVVDEVDENGRTYGPDWHQTTIAVEDLRLWLKSRGITT